MSRARAAFLDRDGTLIEDLDYLADPDQVRLLPGVPAGLRALRDAGYRLIVVTNQSGIARGLIRPDEYERVRRRIDALLAADGVALDGVYHCPHHPDITGPCACRKPAPGLYEQAAAEHGIDLARSVFIGDKPGDVAPAAAWGATAVLVRTGYGRAGERDVDPSVTVVDDFPAAVAHVLGRAAERPATG